MVQSATLTYLDAMSCQPIASFHLDSSKTIVGRAPVAVADLPNDAGLTRGEKTYQVRQGDTLFVVIACDGAMSRQHFCICRSVAASGESEYVLHDLNSRGGTWVNDCQIRRGESIQLNHGDGIRCSSRFLFSLPTMRVADEGSSP
jgi:hypothetical protein